MAYRWGNNGNSDRLYFLGLQYQMLFKDGDKSQMVTSAMELKMLASWKKSCDKLRVLKSRDITLPTKICIVKAVVFPVVMYGP